MRAITMTMIFEACAINRDENIGGTIQSVKKLRRSDGIYTFISRQSMRHHIFNTLVKKHSWKPSAVRKHKDVIQFDTENESILTSEELDFFGYMSTISETVVRKAPVGMTKAVSLEPWEGDMAFYANHDMVRRALESGQSASPNPYQKEEHLSLYKFSTVIDVDRVGKDVTIIDKKTLKSNKKNADDKKGIDKIFGYTIDDLIEGRAENIKVEDLKEALEITVEVPSEIKKRRLQQFLDVLTNGFEFHTSTESWGVTPVFIAAAILEAPIPIFNSYVKLKNGQLSWEAIGRCIANTNVLEHWVYPGNFEVTKEFKKNLNMIDSLKELYEQLSSRLE